MELHYPEYIAQGCAPIYDSEHHCCPNGWRCPTEEDRVTGVAEMKRMKDNKIIQPRLCRFGALKLSVGQKLLFNPTLPYYCSCVTPPMLSCIRQIPLSSTDPPGYMELTARPFDPCSDVKCRPGERCIALVPWRTKCV
ncbi:uncharacterized protein [Anabrus simplex]|uniref:uncharacterized protein n=1 Tax=Anabrus simplex TaxID=316456 RepID=UPI0035A2BE1B